MAKATRIHLVTALLNLARWNDFIVEIEFDHIIIENGVSSENKPFKVKYIN